MDDVIKLKTSIRVADIELKKSAIKFGQNHPEVTLLNNNLSEIKSRNLSITNELDEKIAYYLKLYGTLEHGFYKEAGDYHTKIDQLTDEVKKLIRDKLIPLNEPK
jgi:hypothetical protein